MLGEGGSVSHKRFISVCIAMCTCFGVVYVVLHYKDLTLDILHSSMIFVLIMSGVATVAQITSLITRTPTPDKNEPKNTPDTPQ